MMKNLRCLADATHLSKSSLPHWARINLSPHRLPTDAVHKKVLPTTPCKVVPTVRLRSKYRGSSEFPSAAAMLGRSGVL